MKAKQMLWMGLACALAVAAPLATYAQDQAGRAALRVGLRRRRRIPPGMAMKHFGDRLPQVIPGSEARLYYAGALYTIPEAFEAMRQGNLEMTWMQMGKAAPVDP